MDGSGIPPELGFEQARGRVRVRPWSPVRQSYSLQAERKMFRLPLCSPQAGETVDLKELEFPRKPRSKALWFGGEWATYA